MSTKTKLFSASLIVAASLMTAGIAQAAGKAIGQDEDLATNTSETGGQLNRCWGKVASQMGQNGWMGQHSKSTQAANNTGGFASDNNDFGITFNVKDEDGNAGRDGVGNVSKGENSPHIVHPGDGGNGAHAITNAGLADILHPATGEFQTTPDASPLGCE